MKRGRILCEMCNRAIGVRNNVARDRAEGMCSSCAKVFAVEGTLRKTDVVDVDVAIARNQGRFDVDGDA